jgi:hypothetical protein
MHTLEVAYTVAKTQVENSTSQKPFKDTVRNYLSSFMPYTKTSNLPAPNLSHNRNTTVRENSFIPNGVLRAHVIKGECCLLSSILQLTQENMLGYLKCGLNLRRGNLIVTQNYYLLLPPKKAATERIANIFPTTAYNSYSIVWQEYKKMGQEYSNHMDRDTVSGAVHLILSSLPTKLLSLFSALGWESDKQLGFALLKLCLEGRGIRSPLASLT